MTELSFFAPSRIAGQGSKRALGPGRMVEMSKYVKPFRDAVATSAREAVEQAAWVCTGEAVLLYCTFQIARPKKPKYWYPPTPDVDKCLRALSDAMKGVVYNDDKQIIGGGQLKEYGEPGVHVRVLIVEAP